MEHRKTFLTWFVEGLKLEDALAVICLIYGIVLCAFPELALESKATIELYWAGYGRIVGVPFLLKALFTGWGIISSIKGWPYSQVFRCCGALVGSFIWSIMIWKFSTFGGMFAFGSVCVFVFLLSSIGVIAMALATLSMPGPRS